MQTPPSAATLITPSTLALWYVQLSWVEAVRAPCQCMYCAWLQTMPCVHVSVKKNTQHIHYVHRDVIKTGPKEDTSLHEGSGATGGCGPPVRAGISPLGGAIAWL